MRPLRPNCHRRIKFARHLSSEVHDGKVGVGLISGAKLHIFQPGYLHVAFTGQDPSDLVRDERNLINKDVHLIAEDAERIDLKAPTVTLKSGERLHYDYVIIATGYSTFTSARLEQLRKSSSRYCDRRLLIQSIA